MQISGHFTINAPFATVWDILAINYQDVGKWASSISHSTSNRISSGRRRRAHLSNRIW